MKMFVMVSEHLFIVKPHNDQNKLQPTALRQPGQKSLTKKTNTLFSCSNHCLYGIRPYCKDN